MRFLKPLMMTILIAVVFVSSPLTQAKTSKPAASAQLASPENPLKVEGLRAWFGDTADEVKAAYHTNQELQPPDPAWGARSRPSLWLKAEGVDYFFDEKGKVGGIRVDDSFGGKVNGIKIGDGLAKMCKALGRPDRSYKPFKSPLWDDYLYGLGDITIEFQMENDVIQTAWLRDAKSQAILSAGAQPFRHSMHRQVICGAVP
jgi:hypothetical protein